LIENAAVGYMQSLYVRTQSVNIEVSRGFMVAMRRMPHQPLFICVAFFCHCAFFMSLRFIYVIALFLCHCGESRNLVLIRLKRLVMYGKLDVV